MQILALAVAALPVAFSASAGTFSYKPGSDKAPNSWASLDLGPNVNNQCGGSSQSGIDVPTHSCDTFGDYIFSAGSCTLDDIDFTINDHTILASYRPDRNGCTVPRMVIPGKPVPYDVLQFHLHTGTDHAVDGQYFGACMHLVHQEVGGNSYSVLGFFFDPTDADGVPKFSDLLSEWEKIPVATAAQCATSGRSLQPTTTPTTTTSAEPTITASVDPTTTATVDTTFDASVDTPTGGARRTKEANQDHRKLPRSFNPYDLIPSGSSMYTYQGSLTTPPCSEVVFWNVIDTPVSISVREFLRLTNLILDWVNPATCEEASGAAASGFTGRPVQAINGREINRICKTGFDDPLAEVVKGNNGAPTTPTVDTVQDDNTSGAVTASAMAALAVAVVAAMM